MNPLNMLSKKRLKIEGLNWQHISAFGSFGEPLKRFADQNGCVCWDTNIHNEARLLPDDELEYEYNAWVNEMDSGDWGEMDPGREDPNNPENYADWRYLRSGAAAYAVEKAIRNVEKWRKTSD